MDQKTEQKPTLSPAPDQQSGDGTGAAQQGHAKPLKLEPIVPGFDPTLGGRTVKVLPCRENKEADFVVQGLWVSRAHPEGAGRYDAEYPCIVSHVDTVKALPCREDEQQAFDKCATSPAFRESFQKLLAESDAKDAERDAAIARGELVLSPDGRLLPAGDPALVPGYTPPRPPTVAFIAQTQGVELSLAVYPDHERLVGCDGSRGIQVWDLRSGQELCRRENLPSPIDHLAVSPDGLRVVGIDRNGSVFTWDAQNLTPIAEAAKVESYASLLGRATKVRTQFYSVFTKSGVELYVDGGKVCARWPNQEPGIVLLATREPECIQLAISDDGLYTAVMVIDAPDSLIAVFETEHLLCPSKWAEPDDPYPEAVNSWGQGGSVQEMVFSPDGQTLAVRWWQGSYVDIWDFRKETISYYGTYTHVPITAFAFLGNKKMVVGRDNEIEVLDLELHAVET